MMYESVYDLDNSAKHFHHFHHFILSSTIVTNLHNTPSTQPGASTKLVTLLFFQDESYSVSKQWPILFIT